MGGLMEETHLTQSEEETQALGRALAGRLRPGSLVALFGGLGAGKTAFVRGLAQGLGIDPVQVSSPTFALVNEYRSRQNQSAPTLCHFDMYRVQGEEALESTGFFDYRSRGCILAVEWSEHIREFLPEDRVEVTLESGAAPNERAVTIRWPPP